MLKSEKFREIEDLKGKLSTLKEKRDELNIRAREFAEKRDKINEKIKALHIEIQKLKSAREDINSKVKELKQQESLFKKEAYEKIVAIKKLIQENRDLARIKPYKNSKTLQMEIQKIEWKIQTESLDLRDERELVGKVKEFERHLSIHRKIEKLNEKIMELNAEIKALYAKAKTCHDSIEEKAVKSREIHEEILRKIEEAQRLKAEASALHNRFLEAREESKECRKEIAEILGEINRLKGEIKSEEECERKKIEEDLMENLEKKAREKLKRGEKLTWEEFKVLTEKGIA